MKTLSLLLLLTLGLGAAWWTQAHPGGTLEDVRRDADTLAVRANAVLERVRGEAVDALGLAIGQPDAAPAATAPEDIADSPAAATGTADGLAATVATTDAADTADAPDTALPSPATAETETAIVEADAVPADTADATVADAPAFDARLAALETRLGRADAEGGDGEGGDGEVLRTRLAETERRLDDVAEREARTLERLTVIDERLVTLADRLDTLGTVRLGGTAGAAPGIAVDGASSEPDDATDVVSGEEIADTTDGEPVEGDDTFADDARPVDPIVGRLDTLAAGLDRRLARLEALAGETRTPDTARLDALTARLDALTADAANDDGTEGGADSGTGNGTGNDVEDGDALADTAATRDAAPAATDDSVDAVQRAIRSELAEIDEQVDDETASEDAPALGEALESTRERLATLEERVQAMPASSAATDTAKSTQDALEAQVRQLEERLEALAGADPALADSISAVREQIDELASRGFVTQDELRAQTEGRNVEYKIYFGPNRTDISPDAARVLDSFIAQEQNRTTGVSIFGFTDRRGSASYNQRLALERATAVRSYLIRNGLPYTKIRTLSGLGEDAAAAILPDDADDAQQRVVVLFAAQP